MKKHLPVNGKTTTASRLKIGSTDTFSGLLVKGLVVLFLLCAITQVGLAQAPTLSYTSPKSFVANAPITPVTPTASGVASPGFNSTGNALATGTPQEYSLAVNKAGDIYFVNGSNETVQKIPHGSSTAIVAGTNFNDAINNIALDVDGNVYVAFNFSSTIKKLTPGGAITVVSNIKYPDHFAFDKAGNMYVFTVEPNVVQKIPIDGGPRVTLDFANPVDVTGDAYGHVYVRDGTTLKQIPEGGGPAISLATVNSNLNNSIAVDPSGAIYQIINHSPDASRYTITKTIIGGSTTPVPVATGTGFAWGIGTDASGNLFVTENGNNLIRQFTPKGGYYINPYLPAGLKFNDTTGVISGTPTAVSPATDYTVSAYNLSGKSTAVVNIGVLPDSAKLKSLSADPVTFSPQFSPEITDYSATAHSDITSINIAAATLFSTAHITVNGVTTSGTAAANIPIAIGPNAIQINVADPGNTFARTYTLNVNRLRAPLVSYSSPQVYKVLEPVTPLVPTGSQLVTPGFSHTTLFTDVAQPNHIGVDGAGNIYTVGSGGCFRYPKNGGAKVHMEPIDDVGTAAGDISIRYFIHGLAVAPAGKVFISYDSYFNSGLEYSSIIVEDSLERPVSVDDISPFGLALHNGVLYFIEGKGIGGTNISSDYALQELAIDNNGDFYATSNNLIVKFLSASHKQIVIDRGFGHLSGIAVDGAGNIYVGDADNHCVKMIPASGGALITLATGLTNPCIAVDNANNVYIADSGTNSIQKLTPNSGYFISPQLPDGLIIDLSTGIISGTPTTVSPATSYTVTNFNNTLPGISVVNIRVDPPARPTISYDTPNTYITGTAITPLTAISNKVWPVAYKNTPNTFASGVSDPGPLAMDKVGNVYVAESGRIAVKKIPVGGGEPITLPSRYGFIGGLAVDSTGNLFVCDEIAHDIFKYPAGGGPRVVFASGINIPTGLATDRLGNVYVSDFPTGEIKKIDHSGGVPVVIGSGIIQPTTLAVDNSGNVYVVASNPTQLLELPVGGGPAVQVASAEVIASVATDASGYVYYVAHNLENTVVVVKKFFPGNSNNPVTIPNLNIESNNGFIVDPLGRMYVSEIDKNTIDQYVPTGGYYINQPLPVGLAFDSNTGAISGTPTAVSPATNYTVTAYNVTGTAASTFSIRTVLPDSSLLANLSISAGKLSPDFVQTTTGYTAKVLNNQTSITINATADFADAQITLNGVTTAGTATGTVALNQGQNVINTVVTSPGGGTTKTYSVTITRLPPPTVNANLDGLSLSNSAISPAFSQTTANYTATVSYQTTSTTITPVTRSAIAVMTVNDMPATSGTPVNVVLTPGPNYIKTIITAADGTVKTYMVILTRTLPAKNANLSGLSVNKGSLMPVFTPATTDYADTVEATVTTVRITPATADVNATVTVNGTVLPSGTASAAIPVQVGDNSINTVVTAEDGKTIRTYSVNVNRRPTANANLDNLILSAGTLSPAFDPKTANYAVILPIGNTSVTLTPIARSSTSTITVNGHTVVSGNASPPLPLLPGDNYLKTIVKAADGTIKTYMVIVTEPYPSTNAFLSNLTISAGTFNYPFSRNMTSYRDTVPNSVNTVTVTPTLEDPTATMTVNGMPLASGTTSQVLPLVLGDNLVAIQCTAQGGERITYNILVHRKSSSDASLSGLSTNGWVLSPVFNTNTNSYTASVPNSLNAIRTVATANDPTATININGTTVASGSESPDIHLTTGNNTIHVVVTAQNGSSTKTYTIIVNRALSSDANLTNLTIYSSTLSPSFSATTTSYTATISSALTVLHVTPTTSDATATVTVNGTTVPSGTASAGLPMAAGANTITTVVTAQDGTVKTYILIVTRSPSSNANLDGLAINHGTLSPVFSTGTTAYEVAISNSTTTVKVTPTASSDESTITVNGTTIASGDISADINMDPGYNLIAVKVTAEDGTIRTYNITVTRAISNNANLDDLVINSGTLSPTFAPGTTAYSVSIDNSRTTIRITPTVSNTYATVTVNGTAVPSGTISSPIHMDVGFNLVAAQVTAQDGSVKTYNITITRATGPLGVINPGNTSTAFTSTADSTSTLNDGITVHQGVSPNGDGVNDYLVIDRINNYPDNKLTIMDRSGAPIFEASNYDNSQKVFDGHSGKNGRLQPAGTYFYVLEYKTDGVSKRKTGYVILKY